MILPKTFNHSKDLMFLSPELVPDLKWTWSKYSNYRSRYFYFDCYKTDILQEIAGSKYIDVYLKDFLGEYNL